MMSEVQLWFPVCLTCKEITKFPGPKSLPPEEIKCQKCGAVCEDANAMVERGELTLVVSDIAARKFIKATDTLFRNPDGSWM